LAMPLLRIVVFSLVAGMLVAFVAPVGAFGLLFWLALAFLLYITLLFAVREVNELGFRLLKALTPKSIHGVIDQVHSLYFRNSAAPGPEV